MNQYQMAGWTQREHSRAGSSPEVCQGGGHVAGLAPQHCGGQLLEDYWWVVTIAHTS